MPDFPGDITYPTCVISTLSNKEHMAVYPAGGGITAGVWPAINRALYTPFWIEEYLTAYQMTIVVSVQSGNFDIGILDERGNRIVSAGSTAVGAVGIQNVNITDTLLAPGCYFAAMNCDNVTAQFNRTAPGTQGWLQMCGCQQQNVGALPIPNPVTFSNVGQVYVPMITINCMSPVI